MNNPSLLVADQKSFNDFRETLKAFKVNPEKGITFKDVSIISTLITELDALESQIKIKISEKDRASPKMK